MKHHVTDHWGQFHGNFKSYAAALEWVQEHESADFGLVIHVGVYSKAVCTNNHIMTTTTTKNTIATLKNLITMIEIDHVSASDFAEYDCLGLIPDTKEAKIIHLQNLIIAELESAIA